MRSLPSLHMVFLATITLAVSAIAQWNPSQGQWRKSHETDVRVMTWNVADALCSTNVKTDTLVNWNGIVRIVASMRPDVLLIQEAGDNSGNGTGSGVDSRPVLRQTIDLFLYGGTDPFRPGSPEVTSYVQKYAPDYDLPFYFVSNETDGFNRNVILSRFPFEDLNGDGVVRYSDIPLVVGDLYAPGGTGGIRGFMFGELELPDGVYAGDLIVGNAHLKSGGSASDLAARLLAAQNVAYFIDHFYNGAGQGIPDPRGKILDSPPATMLPPQQTLIVIGGDWNEDESKNGRRGPAAWLTQAEIDDASGGGDGTDFDRSDMTYDAAANVFTGATSTQSSSKLDYIAWQDSIAWSRREFIFNTAGLTLQQAPPEIADYGMYQLLTALASDHRPVIVDLVLPPAAAPCPTDLDGDGQTGLSDLLLVLASFGTSDGGDADGDGQTGLSDLLLVLASFGPCEE